MKASFEYEEDGNHVEEFLTSYNEEDRQNAQINAENAKLVFSPKFIPFYPQIVREHDLNATEAILYGFIEFYLANSPKGRFYFSNDQLSYILNCTDRHIRASLSKLKACGLIKSSHKVKAGGGTIRFVSLISDRKSTSSLGGSTVPPNNNKIKENKINKLNTFSNENDASYKEIIQILFQSYSLSDLQSKLEGFGESTSSYKQKVCEAFGRFKTFEEIWELCRKLEELKRRDGEIVLNKSNANRLHKVLREYPWSLVQKAVQNDGDFEGVLMYGYWNECLDEDIFD